LRGTAAAAASSDEAVRGLGGGGGGGGARRAGCRPYGLLVDDGRPGAPPVTLCGGSRRVSDAYLSTGSTLQVRITAGLAPNDFQRFVLAYTGQSGHNCTQRLCGDVENDGHEIAGYEIVVGHENAPK